MYCEQHAREAESYRADGQLLDAGLLAEWSVTSPLIPRYLIDVARTNPLDLLKAVAWVRGDPRQAGRSLSATWNIVTRHEDWREKRARCASCRQVVNGSVRVSFGQLEDYAIVHVSVCEECYFLTDEIAYRSNPWWCPRCHCRPDDALCLCAADADPPELRLGRRLAGEDGDHIASAAAVLLALAERDRQPQGIRASHPGRPNGVPIPVHFVLDELNGARLAFVVGQLARRHVKEGALGPAWRRRESGSDLPLEEAPPLMAPNPAPGILSRLHAVRTLATLTRLATRAQLGAIEAKRMGRPLSGSERVALLRLRERAREAGLVPPDL